MMWIGQEDETLSDNATKIAVPRRTMTQIFLHAGVGMDNEIVASISTIRDFD